MGFSCRLSVMVAPILVCGIAFGHGGATGIVKERMDQMGELKESMKVLNAVAKGEHSYDSARMMKITADIAAHGGSAMTRLFPEGSLDHPTEALPKIWTEWKTFETLAQEMSQKAEALLALTGSNAMMPDGFKPGFQALALTCKACHDKFRVK